MPKKPNLAEAFNPGDELQPKPQLEVLETKPAAEEEPKKKHIGGYFDLDVYMQVKILCAEEDMTTQEFLRRGFKAIFDMYNKPPIT